MSFEEALVQRLLDAPLASQLAHWGGTRAVHWGDRPEGAGLAAIVLTMIVGGIGYTHQGRDRLRIAQVQADVLAQSYGSARMIAHDLGRLLERPALVGTLTFTHGFVDRDQDIPVRDLRGTQSVYGRSVRLSIYCKE